MNAVEQTYRIPKIVLEETEKHGREVDKYLSGQLSEEMFRSWRVPRGIYGQRQKKLYMVRIRVPGGFLAAAQARRLADLSQRFANGSIHVTTRQDVQFHDVEIANTPIIMEQLLEAGLTPLGGGGNTVRNITTCSHSGIFPGEIFNTLPYAIALTNHLLALKDSYNLPRKLKIAFSCCAGDGSLAQVNDLGFVARIQDGEKGFAVYAGGGMGTYSRLGNIITPFLPSRDIIRMTEAVKRLFVRHGDRRNRHRARLRFAVERLGIERFRHELEQELNNVVADSVPEAVPVELEQQPQLPAGKANNSSEAPGYEAWLGTAVQQQKQEGLFSVHILLKRGDLPAVDLLRLAEVAEIFSSSQLRLDRRQNLVLPHIPAHNLPAVYEELQKLSVNVCGTEGEPWMVSCKGAATCSLGVCRSQDLNTAISAAAAEAGIAPRVLRELGIHTSGCPNNCGQHAVAALGFFGAVRRAGSRSYPVYNLVIGGGHDSKGGFNLSKTAARIPARNIPSFTVELLKGYLASEAYEEGFLAYWQKDGQHAALKLAESFTEVPDYSNSPEFYRDWGADEDFSLAGRSQGECGAGVIELIVEELKKSEEVFTLSEQSLTGQAGNLLEATSIAAGALLVTRGIEPGNPDIALKEFERQFIDQNLAGEEHRELLVLARAELYLSTGILVERKDAVRSFLDEVQGLYDQMDASLNFPVKPQGTRESSQEIQELNLRGVSCPMNFVHAKVALEQLAIGNILDVIVDKGEPAENVPASFKEQGQEVLAEDPEGSDHFRIRIRRVK